MKRNVECVIFLLLYGTAMSAVRQNSCCPAAVTVPEVFLSFFALQFNRQLLIFRCLTTPTFPKQKPVFVRDLAQQQSHFATKATNLSR